MKKILIICTILSACLFSVSAKKPSVRDKAPETSNSGMVSKSDKIIGSKVPKAILYSMNGDYADKVPVNLTEDRSALTSFPDPRDITPDQEPIIVGEGLYLDRRGISSNTVFTNWTYEEYHALESVPSPAEIMNNIIPGSGITEIIALPMNIYEAKEDTEAVRYMVLDGLKGATIIYRQPGAKVTISTGEPGPRPTLMTGGTPTYKRNSLIAPRKKIGIGTSADKKEKSSETTDK